MISQLFVEGAEATGLRLRFFVQINALLSKQVSVAEDFQLALSQKISDKSFHMCRLKLTEYLKNAISFTSDHKDYLSTLLNHEWNFEPRLSPHSDCA